MPSLTLNSRLIDIEQVPDVVQCVLINRAINLFTIATHVYQASSIKFF